jgi:nucleoside-diphosphate-sugar epimerase
MKRKDKILITGGAGYIGSMLSTKLLNLGYKVTVIDLLKFDKNSLLHLASNKNFNFIYGDTRNKKLLNKELKKHDVIIPLAALVGAPLCEKFPKLAKEINLNIIKYILSKLSKKQKIIYPNTNSGYGIGKKNAYCTEKSDLNPISLYGRTKVEAEKLILKHKNSVVFRLATVFGFSYRMRTDLLVNFLVHKAVTKKKLDIFQPNFRRNYIHVCDVVNAFVYSIKKFKVMRGNIYNVGLSNANLTKLQLAMRIKKIVKNTKIKILKNKKDPDKRDYYVSNRKIEKIGFKPNISLDDGIKELKKIFLINRFEKNKNNY